MSTEVPVDAPWEAPNARRVGRADARAPGSTSNSVSAAASARWSPVATRPIFGAEPRELSLLFTLFYIASSGNEQNPGTFERNFNTRDGAQKCRFVGGSQLIAQRIAQQLGARVRAATRRCAGSSRTAAA